MKRANVLSLDVSAHMLVSGSMLLLAPLACLAASAFDSGVQLYNARQYTVALQQFGSAEKSAPRNPAIHYYIALCYQGQRQFAKAKQEYEWVAYYGTGDWKARAQQALQGLSNYTAATPAAPTEPSTASAQSKAALPSAAKAGGDSGAVGASAPKLSGKLKVIEFSTSWCGPCKAFAPIFESVSNRMSRQADFQTLDAEAPENRALVEKYGINAYPTIIYTDNSGKALNRMEGAPPDEASFISSITPFLPH